MTQREPDVTTTEDDDLVVVNGIDPRTGEYLVAPRTTAEVAEALKGPPSDEEADEAARERQLRLDNGLQKTIEGVVEDDLASAGWGVVFSGRPEDADLVAEQRRLLAPLLEHRKAAAGDLYQEYVDDKGVRNESGADWLARHGVGAGPADPQDMPFYLLLVGEPQQIPFEFQYRVDLQRAVGRLHFDDTAGYARYAQAVVRSEGGGGPAKGLALFGPTNRGDRATALSLRRLVRPLQEKLENKVGWRTTSTTGEHATAAALAALVDDGPALLLTAGHGLGLRVEDPEQRNLQGALVCSGWRGPGNPVRPEDVFAAADVRADADLTGRMAFLFACYGGGTPAEDDFAHRVDPRVPRSIAAHPFVAALPQTLLGRGMLAVMAHVDRAWGYSFGTGRADSTQTFRSTLTRLMNGRTVGTAFDDFNVRTGELAVDLAELLAKVVAGDTTALARYGGTWTSATDARNYVVFGDPAARLAV